MTSHDAIEGCFRRTTTANTVRNRLGGAVGGFAEVVQHALRLGGAGTRLILAACECLRCGGIGQGDRCQGGDGKERRGPTEDPSFHFCDRFAFVGTIGLLHSTG